MIRYVVDVAATASATPSRSSCASTGPAAEQRLSLPVWIPGSYLVREFARHLSALGAEQGGAALPLRAARQGDLAGPLRRPTARWSCATRSTPSTPRCARRFSMPRAASSTAPASACASRAAKASRTRSRSPACRAGWQVATTLDAASRAARRTSSSPPTTTSSSTIRSSSAASGAARFDAAGVAARVRRRRRLARLRRRAAARRHAAHLRGRDRASGTASGQAPFERYLFLLNARRGRPRRPRAPREHGAGRAAARPAATRRGRAAKAPPTKAEPSDGYVGLLGLIATSTSTPGTSSG